MRQPGITYRYALIDDVAAKVIRSQGRHHLGLQELRRRRDERPGRRRLRLPAHDDQRAGQSPDGNFEYEAAHGTVTDHYYRYQKGEAISTNPLATIFAWAGALRKRGELDGNAELIHYADCLNQAGLDVFEEGYLSEDLAVLCDPAELKEMPENAKLMKLIRARLEALLAA